MAYLSIASLMSPARAMRAMRASIRLSGRKKLADLIGVFVGSISLLRASAQSEFSIAGLARYDAAFIDQASAGRLTKINRGRRSTSVVYKG
jgi:hypothetical protein